MKWEPEDVILFTLMTGFFVLLPALIIVGGIIHDVWGAAMRGGGC